MKAIIRKEIIGWIPFLTASAVIENFKGWFIAPAYDVPCPSPYLPLIHYPYLNWETDFGGQVNYARHSLKYPFQKLSGEGMTRNYPLKWALQFANSAMLHKLAFAGISVCLRKKLNLHCFFVVKLFKAWVSSSSVA